ncbi:FAD-dependent oxidoreductase [Salinibacterium sp. ZJ454]|uniref:FAD-dependent oxidoreductase n=1 Tax=Salinibacterium sp. ZJ454 TaxID=2708339 RepID=UPI001AB05CF9|nr:FAD-dependent oxidoreductase [Salinibacterium sp. ZJ454]
MTANPTTPTLNDSYDLVVVGAGACGMVAALAASDAGKSVLVLEKLETPGGNSTLSTGSVPGANTRFQREAGIEDSPERMIHDLLQTSGSHEAENLVRLMAESSAEIVEWLVDRHDIGLYLITDYKHVGHSVPRLHAPADRNGANLTADLQRACERAGVSILTRTPVVGLLHEDGAVTGVTAELSNGQRQDIPARAVLLASNGFGANRAMLERWIPEMVGTVYHGAPGSTGEGIEWAEQLGAALANVRAYQAYAAVATDAGDILSWTTVELGAIIVGPEGTRLGDESVGYSAFAEVVARQTPYSFTIMDKRIFDYVARNEPRFVKIINLDCVQEAPDTAALAAYIGCDEVTLSATLDTASAAAAGTAADQFGRTDFGLGALEPPYFVCKTHPAMFHTQGGVAIDTHARVVTPEGRPIRGLYAGGGVAAGISGQAGADGYASGNGLSTAIGLGYAAGRHVGSREE